MIKKQIVAVLLTLVLIFSTFTVASFAGVDVVKNIFDFLVEDMNLTPAAASGVLANIEYESDFDYLMYGDNGTSFGICQWHNERFDNLKKFCNKNGYNWKSLDGQLNFLKYELTNYGCDTGYILGKLKNIDNSAQGAYDAAYAWCYYFERPANREYQADKRGTRAKNYYWEKYGKNYKYDKILLGDINDDGAVNSSDSLIVLKYSVGSQKLDSTQLKIADINSDGKVNSDDSLAILKISVGTKKLSDYK